MKYINLQIASKIWLFLATATILVAVSLSIIASKIVVIQDKVDEMANLHAKQVQLASNLIITAQDRVQFIKNVVLLKQPDDIKNEFLNFVAVRQSYQSTFSELNNVFEQDRNTSNKERQLLSQIYSDEERFIEYENQILNFGLLGQDKDAVEIYLSQARPLFNNWRQKMDELQKMELGLNHFAAIEIKQLADNVLVTMALIGLGFVIGGFISRIL